MTTPMKPTDAPQERQVEDMYGRPTGPRHEEIGTRSREADRGAPIPEDGRGQVKDAPGQQSPRREAPEE